MKRKAMIVLFMLLCSSAFSAGYRGTYWGEPMQELANKGLLFEMIQDENFVYMREQARVLGQSTNIWYCLSNQKLVGIGYTVEDTPEAREQIDKLLETRKLKLVKRTRLDFTEEQAKQFRKSIEELSANKRPFAGLMVDDIVRYNLGAGAVVGDFLLKEDTEGSTVEFIKADYDYNTEVHIWAGILYGYILVAYTETPQDF